MKKKSLLTQKDIFNITKSNENNENTLTFENKMFY